MDSKNWSGWSAVGTWKRLTTSDNGWPIHFVSEIKRPWKTERKERSRDILWSQLDRKNVGFYGSVIILTHRICTSVLEKVKRPRSFSEIQGRYESSIEYMRLSDIREGWQEWYFKRIQRTIHTLWWKWCSKSNQSQPKYIYKHFKAQHGWQKVIDLQLRRLDRH